MASALDAGKSRVLSTAPSVKYVLEGEGQYRIKGRTYCIRPGSFLFVDAEVEVEARMPSHGPTIGLCVNLGMPEGLPREPADAMASGDPLVGSAIDPLAAVLDRYARLLRVASEPDSSLLRQILAETSLGIEDYLVRHAAKARRLPAIKHSTRMELLRRVERARAFIHDNAEGPLTLDAIAQHATLSRFHLTRSFTEAIGVPPLAYHRRLRMQHAARLLSETAMNVTQVAERLGYSSLVTFSRAFYEELGVRPSGLRRRR
jgi:AraC-like DNA-binding protein